MGKTAVKKVAKKKKARTNPHGVNQYTGPDPRQTLFIDYYFNPKSKTFSNAYQSALRAKYSEAVASTILSTEPDWLLEKRRQLRKGLLDKAERNIDTFLDLPTRVQAMGAFGPIIDKKTKKPVMVENGKLLEIKQKTSHFVAQTIGKDAYGKDDKIKLGFQFNITAAKENYSA